MEDLFRLVSDCLARHGLVPAGDLQAEEPATKLAAAPLLEALPEHNYRDHNYGKTSPPDAGSLRGAETAGRGTAAL
jgi:hypothetical protein